ncbi:MAG: hypothetical protein H3C43_06190 [Leptonema sp. (in: Bacteria)]|nr:hypothetical protein [Leptonema sp. (in: bacteria)]
MKQAAIFDFDSRIFGKDIGWRITDPRIGLSGSVKDSNWMLEFWQKHQNENDFRIGDKLSLVEPESVESAKPDTIPFLPLEYLASTAQLHRIRSRSLFLLTAAVSSGLDLMLRRIIETTFEKTPGRRSNLPAQRGNPLDEAEFLELRPVDFEGIRRIDDMPKARLQRLSSLISIHDQQEAERPGPFERIFFYTSDLQMAELTNRFINENQHRFIEGRNALMLSFITKVNTETTSAVTAYS